MRIGYNPLVDFFSIHNEVLFYDDFIGDMFTVRNHGNIVLDEDYTSVILAKIFRPLWTVQQGAPIMDNQRLHIPIGNVANQECSTPENEIGIYWRFNFQFAAVPTVNDMFIRFWWQDANNWIACQIDVVGGTISLFSQQAGGPIIIIGPVVQAIDDEPHYFEVVYDGVDQWQLFFDGIAAGAGADVFSPNNNGMRILNTADAAIDFDYIKCQNYSPI